MARIFVSYNRADRQFVDEFVPLLRKVYGNDSVWFDDDIPGGHQWWQHILSEINKCDLFIFLLSNEALTSAYCQAEFREALRLQKPFLPVIVRPKTRITDSAPGDLRDKLEQTQWVDLSRGFKDYQANAALYAAINTLLEQDRANLSVPLATQPVSEPVVTDSKRQGSLRVGWSVVAAVGLVALISIAILLSLPSGGQNNMVTTSTDPRMTQTSAQTPFTASNTPPVAAESQAIACIIAQSGGTPARVRLDTLFYTSPDYGFEYDYLPLAGGQKIFFTSITSFEAVEILDGGNGDVRVEITLHDGEIITDVVEYSNRDSTYLVGSTEHSPFNLRFYNIKRVDFREQGPCQ